MYDLAAALILSNSTFDYATCVSYSDGTGVTLTAVRMPLAFIAKTYADSGGGNTVTRRVI